MNTIETIFLVLMFVIVYVLAFAIDHRQVKRHEKIKQDHLKSYEAYEERI
jgi:preprotein translocase subunit YajC